MRLRQPFELLGHPAARRELCGRGDSWGAGELGAEASLGIGQKGNPRNP